jgi:hypothetical protein
MPTQTDRFGGCMTMVFLAVDWTESAGSLTRTGSMKRDAPCCVGLCRASSPQLRTF